MKTIPKLFLLAALALVGTTARSFGGTYDFSYVFGDGLSITGSLNGTQSGLFINNISAVSVYFDGTAMPGTVFASTLDSADDSLSGPIVSFDVTQNNFVFSNSDYVGSDFSGDSVFAISNAFADSDYAAAQSFSLNFFGSQDLPPNSSWTLAGRARPRRRCEIDGAACSWRC